MISKCTYLLCLLVATFLLGCPPQSQEAPFAGERWAPHTYDYAGIRVVQAWTARPLVEIRLVFCHDPSRYTNATPFMDHLALANLIKGGTSSLEPAEFSYQLAKEKMDLSFGVNDGYSWVGMSCLKSRIRPAWDLFVSCAASPGFHPTTFSYEISEIEQNSKLWAKLPVHGLAQLILAKGFAPLPFKTGMVLKEDWVAPTPESVLQWYRSNLLGKSRLALVVTGPVDPEVVTDLLLKGLTDLDHLPWEGMEAIQPKPPSPGLYLEKSPEGKEAIALYLPFIDPKGEAYVRTAVEEAAFLIFGQLFAERLEKLVIDDPQARKNIRFTLSLGARPGAWLMLEGIQVMPRAELIMSELRRFYQVGALDSEVLLARRVLLIGQLSALQSNRQQADLWTKEIGQGSLERWEQVVNGIQEVPKKAVVKVGRVALENLSWFYYGVPSRADRNSLERLN